MPGKKIVADLSASKVMPSKGKPRAKTLAAALNADKGFAGLAACNSISILGHHDGVLEDDLFEHLKDGAA